MKPTSSNATEGAPNGQYRRLPTPEEQGSTSQQDITDQPLKIVQWNINRFKTSKSTLQAIIKEENFDFILLQESLMQERAKIFCHGYNRFSSPSTYQKEC